MDPPPDLAKRAAAARAIDELSPGLAVALGTGSTAAEALRAIAGRFGRPAPLDCVASSRATEELARSLGIPVRPLKPEDRFDLMLDGADEVTPSLDLTKGGGGALFREKFLARLSRRVVILVDDSKLVRHLGESHAIPVEVVPFARPVLAHRWAEDGWKVTERPGPGGRPFVTDNGNEILDLQPRRGLEDPSEVDQTLGRIEGVVATGLFCGIADRVVIGHPDGTTDELRRPDR
ncbi:MAG: ribose-5-phosphate isomerase RpiA [Thermoplasmata archaeon]